MNTTGNTVLCVLVIRSMFLATESFQLDNKKSSLTKVTRHEGRSKVSLILNIGISCCTFSFKLQAVLSSQRAVCNPWLGEPVVPVVCLESVSD
jgi:hypothetical protein